MNTIRRQVMKKIKLTKQEKEIEDQLLTGEYVDVSEKERGRIVNALVNRKKDAVVNKK